MFQNDRYLNTCGLPFGLPINPPPKGSKDTRGVPDPMLPGLREDVCGLVLAAVGDEQDACTE